MWIFSNLSNGWLITIIFVLTFIIAFVLLPSIFNQKKKLWYLKKNSNGGPRTESMFYDAKKGRIEADQTPLH